MTFSQVPQVPSPAQNAPSPVGVTGGLGTVTTRFALEDHMHASSVQAQHITAALTGTTGRTVWTYPTPYDPSITPTVLPVAETPDGANYFYQATLIAGTVTNTSVTIQVDKVSQSTTLPGVLTSLLNLVVNTFQPATGTVVIHCWARTPTPGTT